MSRRKFLLIALVAIFGVVAAAFFWLYDFDKLVLRMLRKDLAGLKIKEEDFLKYIQEARSTNYWNRIHLDEKKQAFMALFHLLPNVGLPYQFKYFQLKSTVVGNFLLSTDFFYNKMDETREIKYITLFDPEIKPCQNPFSNLFYK
jgi:hypothetical protein